MEGNMHACLVLVILESDFLFYAFFLQMSGKTWFYQQLLYTLYRKSRFLSNLSGSFLVMMDEQPSLRTSTLYHKAL